MDLARELMHNRQRGDDEGVGGLEDVASRPATVVVVRYIPQEGGAAVERAPLATVMDAVERGTHDEGKEVRAAALRDQQRDDARE